MMQDAKGTSYLILFSFFLYLPVLYPGSLSASISALLDFGDGFPRIISEEVVRDGRRRAGGAAVPHSAH